MITYSSEPQGTDQWLQERCGLLTASQFKIAVGKGQGRQDLMDALNFQARTGVVESGYKNAAMQRGNDLEPGAREYLSLMLGKPIREVGLATNSDLPGLGASLDGLIGDNIGAEIKCPGGKTHNRYLRQGRLPAAYKEQVYGQMLVCELEGVWFFSYHPFDTRQLVLWVPRDEKIITELKGKLLDFQGEMLKQQIGGDE